MMKKYLFGLTTLAFSTITLCSNASNIVNVTLNNEQQSGVINIQQSDNKKNKNAVENWYKFLATNDWKVFITRDTWFYKILAWMGDSLLGELNTDMLHKKIYDEYKSWTNSGNRNFSDWEYEKLVIYTIEHAGEITYFFNKYKETNRIVFKTDSDVRWVGVEDASI
ncbi:MAG: hypothetical protein REH79_03760 [Spiroplasma sp.]|nr:hypothetical protein [Spiroplasma sp.]